MKYYHFGIDPGIKGAIALIDDVGNGIELQNLPVNIKAGKSGKKELDADTLANLIKKYLQIAEMNDAFLVGCLESVHAMPGQGVVSMFTMGETFGVLRGCLSALKVPTRLVTPQFWKKKLNVTKDKELSREKALLWFPSFEKELRFKKDHDKAEALLLAHFSRLYS